MKLMSEGLQKVAGSKMRSILGKVTENPFRGIITGTAVTTTIQSSSATTVMVVSFVNAGLISLAGAVAVIMGANIGTTITAWIITLFGLGESTSLFSLPMLLGAISLIFIFSNNSKMKALGEFIMGLALLFIGMDLLKGAMPNLEEYPQLLEPLAKLSDFGFWSILLFIAIGTLLTCLLQSSSATMAITLVMCYKGWIGYDVAVGLVMGENIGTTITANMAAMIANSNAKRAARAHFMFNVIGVTLTLILFRPFMNLLALITTGAIGSSPYDAVGAATYNPEAIPFALSLFHTSFNVCNTLIQVWFIPQIIKVVNWMVKPSENDEDEIFKLKHISGSWVNTAELNLEAAQQEITDFSKRVLRMYNFLPDLRTAKNEEEFEKTFERVKKYEEITDRMELEITKYLTHNSEGNLSEEGSQKVSSMLRIIDNLESIGDAVYQIALIRKNKREEDVHFSQDLNDNLDHISQLVENSLQVMDSNLHNDYLNVDLESANSAEKAINDYRDKLRAQHLQALKSGTYDYVIGSAYSGLYALYEKLGDYVINVSEAAAGLKSATGTK